MRVPPARALVHIGTRKTATTTIQDFLAANARHLGEQGIHVPGGLSNNGFELAYAASRGQKLSIYHRHHNITTAAQEAATVAAGEEAIQRAARAALASNQNTVVFSAEDLSVLDPPHIERFVHLLRVYFTEIHVLCCLRAQEDYLASNVTTLLISGSTGSVDSLYFPANAERDFRLDYFSLLNDWCAAVGTENVRVWRHNEASGAGFIRTFLDKARIEHDPRFVFPPASNKSASAVALRLLLSLNLFATNDGSIAANQTRRSWAKRIVADDEGEPWRPGARRADLVRRRFAASNEAVRSKFFPQVKELFPARRQDTWSEPLHPLTPHELWAALAPIMRKTEERLRNQHERALLMEGRVRILEGRPDDAVEPLTRGFQVGSSRRVQFLHHLSLAHERAGRLEEAMEAAELVVSLGPTPAATARLRTLQRRLEGRTDAADADGSAG